MVIFVPPMSIARATWMQSLAVCGAAIVVLLALTFLFPPPWLRAVLDLGLVVGLVWTWRHPERACTSIDV